VEDDGIGFHYTGAEKKGTGLRNIKERVQSMNGHIEITSTSTSGTGIYIEIPIIAFSNV